MLYSFAIPKTNNPYSENHIVIYDLFYYYHFQSINIQTLRLMLIISMMFFIIIYLLFLLQKPDLKLIFSINKRT